MLSVHKYMVGVKIICKLVGLRYFINVSICKYDVGEM